MLIDVDILASGHSVALLKDQRGHMLFRFDDEAPVDFEPGQGLRFLLVRLADENTAVIVSTRAAPGQTNAWVVTRAGQIERAFTVGDGVEDLLAHPGGLVVTYFDEGVFSNTLPSAEGLALFSLDGSFLAGYNSGLSNGVFISDCYCACWRGSTEVCFSPYTDFPLVSLDIVNRTQQVWELPAVLRGARALVPQDDLWYFFVRGTVFRWSPGLVPEVSGTYSGRLRGLSDGLFMDEDTFKVVRF